MNPLQLRILDVSVNLNFCGATYLPANKSFEPFYAPVGGEGEDTVCIEIVDSPVGSPGVYNRRENTSIGMKETGEGLLFYYYTGQFLTDPSFTDVRLWSPHERDISIQRDGYENFNGDPALRLILWGRAAVTKKYCYMHGALVALDNRYVLFMGDSGVGKTTLSSLVCEIGGTCLTEEDPFIGRRGDKPMAYGTPWPGVKGPQVPSSGELSALFFLRHAPENNLRKLSLKESSRLLLHNSRTFNWLPQTIPPAIELLNDVAQKVPAYDFGFVPDQTAVTEIRKVL